MCDHFYYNYLISVINYKDVYVYNVYVQCSITNVYKVYKYSATEK